MQVVINSESHVVEPIAALSRIENLINDTLRETGLYYSHLVVDGIELYNEFEDYFNNHSQSMQIVEVILLTGKQLTERAMLSVLSYLDRALPEVNQLVNLFYMKPLEETWNRLEQLLEGLGWIQDVLTDIQRPEFAGFRSQLDSFMPGLEEALKYKDTTLIADMIQHEIYPLLNSTKAQLQNMVDNEVVRHDLN